MEPESNMPAAVQVELWDESKLPAGRELLTIEEDERRGVFTGERVARNRGRYAGIIRCLAEGTGIRSTARAFGCSTHTVQAIRDRESLAVATEKKELSAQLGHFARMAAERLVEELDCIPIGQLPVAMGIAIDKKAGLDGEASTVIEHRTSRVPDPEDIRAYVASLPSAVPSALQIAENSGEVAPRMAPNPPIDTETHDDQAVERPLI